MGVKCASAASLEIKKKKNKKKKTIPAFAPAHPSAPAPVTEHDCKQEANTLLSLMHLHSLAMNPKLAFQSVYGL
jgi:hypothetical protein